MILALTIIHIVIALVLIVTVLMQHGKQQGLSGAIAGGAETFFGKNKGRTVDAMLKKFTAVFAALFIISSLALTALSAKEYKQNVDAEGNVLMTAEQMAEQQAAQTEGEQTAETEEQSATEETAEETPAE